jgi:hypothetical protein
LTLNCDFTHCRAAARATEIRSVDSHEGGCRYTGSRDHPLDAEVRGGKGIPQALKRGVSQPLIGTSGTRALPGRETRKHFHGGERGE